MMIIEEQDEQQILGQDETYRQLVLHRRNLQQFYDIVLAWRNKTLTSAEAMLSMSTIKDYQLGKDGLRK
jgi:hypothetical protein